MWRKLLEPCQPSVFLAKLAKPPNKFAETMEEKRARVEQMLFVQKKKFYEIPKP